MQTPKTTAQSTRKKAPTARPRRSSLGFLLRAAYRLFVNALEKRLDGHAISHTEFLNLYLLHYAGSLSPGEMTARLEVTKAAGTGILQSLTRKGLIVSEPNIVDSRRIRVALSKRGSVAMEQILLDAREVTQNAIDGFSHEEAEQLYALLSKLIDNQRPAEARQRRLARETAAAAE